MPLGEDRSQGREIAIIGMSGRFPGAQSVDEFWRNLTSRVEATRALRPQDLVLGGENLFDAEMFGFTANEARIAGPQHRIFMECVWEALESAGYLSKTSDVRIGLYAGATFSRDQRQVGNDRDYLSTHVSYKLNLRGPSVGVQTACSTSLVAVWLACQGLNSYECDLVLAGGVTVRHPSDNEEGFGSGAGVVLLKRLDEAIAERDPILAVIKETAVNNDGAVKIGFTASSLEGQVEVVTLAQATAGVHPESIGYIEAHGSDTPLGDSVEIAALTQVFRRKTQKRGFCAIGSVKSMVGHLESAAGVTALIKTVLALQHKQIPPSLHFQSPNSEIDLAASPFYVNTELQEWKNGTGPRRAGVSSFGIGGTNAHVILEEGPALRVRSNVVKRPYHILTLSALETKPLQELAGRYGDCLGSEPELDSVCFTSNTGRRHFRQRLAAVVTSTAELREELAAFAEGKQSSSIVTGEVHGDAAAKVAFLFPGQGSQYAGMGQELYQTQPVFREVLEQCANALAPLLEKPLLEVLYGSESAGLLQKTAYTQPALFAVEYALAKLWESWGILPSVLLGHGVGEYAAACLAGIFSLEDGLRLVAAQGLEQHIEFRRTLARIEFRRPEIPLISNVTGEFAGAEVATADYWMEHVQRPAQLAAGKSRLLQSDCGVLLEVGPQPAPDGMAPQDALENGDAVENGKPWLASLHPEVPEWRQMLLALGRMYVAGAEVNWEAFDAPYEPRRITQPTYPFQRKPYCNDELETEAASTVREPGDCAKLQLKAHPNLSSDPNVAGPAQTETEEKLARIWCDLLRLDRVGNHENFFDLGGHSLLASKLTARIEHTFGRTLPVAALFQAPTIQQLATLLVEQHKLEVIPGILPIQPAGSKLPFFCLGAGPLFRPLAQHLGLDQPFLGLGLDKADIENLPARFTLQDMAAVLAKKMRAIHPGPYFLGGWCMGGVIAYETARQLVAQDETVALLVLFDARNPNPATPRQASNSNGSEWRRLLRRTRYHFTNLRQLTAGERRSYLRDRQRMAAMMLKHASWEVSYKFRLYATQRFKGQLSTFNNMLHVAVRDYRPGTYQGQISTFNNMLYVAARHYRPGTYPGRALLVQANSPVETLLMDPDMGWGDVVQGGLEIHSAAGGHQGMFNEPHVAGLADKLGACLAEAQGHATIQAAHA